MDQHIENTRSSILEILKPLERRHNLFNASHRVEFEPQQVLFNEGEPMDHLYYIERGMIKLINHMPNGRSRIVRLHGSGSAIGVGGIVDDYHEHTAVAVSDVVTYQWPLKAFNSIRKEEPEIYSKLLEHCHSYLKLADTWITKFSTGTIQSRVARLILFLAEVEDTQRDDQVTLLKSEEMGAILGVAPESVSRFVADFKRKGLLRHVEGLTGEHHEVDLEALERIANKD